MDLAALSATGSTKAWTCGSFKLLMRTTDSITAVTSFGSGSKVASEPVLTRPVTSLERDTLVGWAVTSIMVAGAIELPPEIELCEPINPSNAPLAPAL